MTAEKIKNEHGGPRPRRGKLRPPLQRIAVRTSLEGLRLLRDGVAGERDAVAAAVHFDAAHIGLRAAYLAKHGVGRKGFGVNLRYQPSVAGLVQLPKLSQLNGGNGHEFQLLNLRIPAAPRRLSNHLRHTGRGG